MIIVVYLVGQWETFHRRPMLMALARQALGQATIFCINPPISIGQTISLWRRSYRRGLLFFGRAKRLTENLYVGTPIVFLPGAGRRWQQEGSVGKKIVSHQVRNAVYRIGHKTKKIISWIYRPEQFHCLGLAKENFAVYECYDEYTLSYIDGSLIREVEDKEENLIREVDLIFATSYSLFENRRKKHSNVHYAPNGVDFELFNHAALNKLCIANDLKKIPSPRLGYIGNLSSRIDFGLIEKIAKHNKSWSLVIIGPVEEEAKAELASLKYQHNIYYIGYKPREKLLQYLKGFDVCILPFKINDWNYHSNPLKLWEYLAAGKPVVSTPTKEMEILKDVIFLAEDATRFIFSIEKTLNKVDEKKIQSGIEIARGHSWSNLTRKMLETVEKKLL